MSQRDTGADLMLVVLAALLIAGLMRVCEPNLGGPDHERPRPQAID